MTRVLLIGFTADAIDLTGRSYDANTLRSVIAQGDAAVVAAGYEIERAWITADHAAGVEGVRRALTSDRFDVVLIGDGVRAHPQYTELFESLVNVVHELAPASRFAFNADPPTTIDALRRNDHPQASAQDRPSQV